MEARMSWLKKLHEDNLMIFMPEMSQFVEAVRKDERERAARIVETWPIDTHYIVAKQRLKERRQAIAAAIRGEK